MFKKTVKVSRCLTDLEKFVSLMEGGMSSDLGACCVFCVVSSTMAKPVSSSIAGVDEPDVLSYSEGIPIRRTTPLLRAPCEKA
jgi:hypothetical protein